MLFPIRRKHPRVREHALGTNGLVKVSLKSLTSGASFIEIYHAIYHRVLLAAIPIEEGVIAAIVRPSGPHDTGEMTWPSYILRYHAMQQGDVQVRSRC